MRRVREALTTTIIGACASLGGVLFGVGALVLLIRRTSFTDPWGDFVDLPDPRWSPR